MDRKHLVGDCVRIFLLLLIVLMCVLCVISIFQNRAREQRQCAKEEGIEKDIYMAGLTADGKTLWKIDENGNVIQ